MKKSIFSVALAGLLFQGCNQVVQPNTPVKLYTPSKLSVVKKGSKIFVKSSYAKGIDQKQLVNKLNTYLGQNNIFQTVNSIKEADVVVHVSSYYAYRKDNSKQSKYNVSYNVQREVYRNSKGQETGGQDKIVKDSFISSAGTLVFSISIYDKKSLQPLAYLSIIPESSSTSKETLISKSGFQKNFSNQVIKKLEDLISTKMKKVNVFMPGKGDNQLKTLVLQGNSQKAQAHAKTVLPQVDILELDDQFYAKNKEEASKKDSKVAKRDKEMDLSNYYLYLLSKEAKDVSSANLNYLFRGYKQILAQTTDDSLILATANSLGRVEFKANRLKIELGE